MFKIGQKIMAIKDLYGDTTRDIIKNGEIVTIVDVFDKQGQKPQIAVNMENGNNYFYVKDFKPVMTLKEAIESGKKFVREGHEDVTHLYGIAYFFYDEIDECIRGNDGRKEQIEAEDVLGYYVEYEEKEPEYKEYTPLQLAQMMSNGMVLKNEYGGKIYYHEALSCPFRYVDGCGNEAGLGGAWTGEKWKIVEGKDV